MKIGFIGAGNMANAIFAGIKRANIIDKADIYVNSRTQFSIDNVKKNYGYNVDLNVENVVNNASDIIFICVKPQAIDIVSERIKHLIKDNQLIVSIVAGKTLAYLSERFGTKNVVRIMPNTPCLVGAGICAVSIDNDDIKNVESLKEKYDEVLTIVGAMGEYEEVPENYIDIITQVSGASPAWIFMMIEALADGGVLKGLPRTLAYKYAANAVYGAGKLAKDNLSDFAPSTLKDMVCSPGGTTIEGVKVLEDKGFRGAIIDAIAASFDKTKKL